MKCCVPQGVVLNSNTIQAKRRLKGKKSRKGSVRQLSCHCFHKGMELDKSKPISVSGQPGSRTASGFSYIFTDSGSGRNNLLLILQIFCIVHWVPMMTWEATVLWWLLFKRFCVINMVGFFVCWFGICLFVLFVCFLILQATRSSFSLIVDCLTYTSNTSCICVTRKIFSELIFKKKTFHIFTLQKSIWKCFTKLIITVKVKETKQWLSKSVVSTSPK